MRRMRPLLPLVLCAALATGCGEDDGSGTGDVSTDDVYKANVEAQCIDASTLREGIPLPELGSSPELAAYLRQNIEIAEEYNDAIGRIEPPPSQAETHEQAQAAGRELTDVISSYERAARGGRDFDAVMSGLEPEVNSVLERTNAQFESNGLVGCQQELLDFGYSN